jgi:ankyrin repeat protein
MAAATQGQLASVRILLDRGVAKVDEATPRTWLAPKDVAANMLYYGVFVASVGGETALMQAAREAHVEIVSELLRHGADVNRKNASGQSALGYARTGRSHVGDRAAQTERLLLEHGARE